MSGNCEERRMRLAAVLQSGDADAIMISDLVNVRYLSGLASSNAALLLTRDGGVLATDSRYAETAREVCPELPLVIGRDVDAVLAEPIRESGCRAVLFESHVVTVDRYDALTKLLGPVKLVPLGHAVEEIRMVKSEDEIALLRRACEITDQAFARVLPGVRPGMTEREIAVRLERTMVDLGADGPAFSPIVAAGPHGAVPHHAPCDRPIASGDLLTMDFGALCRGYHADMTRTVAVGEPAQWQRDIYALVLDAQSAGIAAARPGADVRDVDAAARVPIADAGHAGDFQHGFGHGVGLEIHESPMLGYGRTGKLADRVPITAEPGVYLAGRGGVRIEDTLVVRADGPELLTKTTKELLVI